MKGLIVACLLVAVCHGRPSRITADGIEPLSDDMVNFINNLNTTWTAGHNWDSTFKVDELKKLLGVVIDDSDHDSDLAFKEYLTTGDIPKEFDARKQWPKCPSISEIRDQGSCGSCWAHGAAEAISDRVCIASNGSFTQSLSVEDILTCCGYADGCGLGCNGGSPDGAWRYWKNTGLVTGGVYNGTGCRPYSIKPCSHDIPSEKLPTCGDIVGTPACEKKCVEGYGKSYMEDKVYGKEAYSLPFIDSIQRDILEHGPVEATFAIYADFPSYKSGVYQRHAKMKLGNHAVKLLGWGEENGAPYWLAANSWNTEWGDQGYFKILRGQDECGIETMGVYAGIPK